MPPPSGALRGDVTRVDSVEVRTAGGVVAFRLLLLALIVVSLVVKGPRLFDLAVQGLTGALFAYLIPIVLVVVVLVLIARFIPIGGCLTAIFRIGMLGAVNRAGRPRTLGGRDVQIQTPSGFVRARIAADVVLAAGDEVVIHGPAFGGVKHAWIVMRLAPTTFTRFGRGVVGIVLATIVVLPLCIVLLVAV